MSDPTPHPQDFLHAERVCSYLNENLMLRFQMDGIEMSRDEAVKHFTHRKALTIVQSLLLEEGERALKAMPE